MEILGTYERYAYPVLRIIAGLMFAGHGSQKLFGVPGKGPAVTLTSLVGLAGMIEFVCGIMIALGLLGSVAAFIASGEMAVAYFKAHAPRGLLPIVNQGEIAVLYCFLFLYVAARGSGAWSLDALLRRQSAEPEPVRRRTAP